MTKKLKPRVVAHAPDLPQVERGPECRDHKLPMRFDPASNVWRCNFRGCKLLAKPKRDETTLVIGKGVPELVVTKDEEGDIITVLFYPENNVVAPLPEFLVSPSTRESLRMGYEVMEQEKAPIKVFEPGTFVFGLKGKMTVHRKV